MFYPVEEYRTILFQNEINFLKRLNDRLKDKMVENGIVKLFDGGNAKWKNDDDEKFLPDCCTAVVYTYEDLLFSILRRCVPNNDRKKFFLQFQFTVFKIKSFVFGDIGIFYAIRS